MTSTNKPFFQLTDSSVRTWVTYIENSKKNH